MALPHHDKELVECGHAALRSWRPRPVWPTTTGDQRLLTFPQLPAEARGEAALPMGWRA